MITLYTFGPAFGQPDASTFVIKTLVQLKLSGLPFETKRADVRKMPKRKLPVIKDNGRLIADSVFIRNHLEDAHGIDLDRGLSAEQRATGWAIEKMCEDHLYWGVLDARWSVDRNFDAGPRVFFNAVPAPLRALVIRRVRRDMQRALYGQGFGRHTRDDIEALCRRDLDALAVLLGDKPFLFGDDPHATDAVAYASLSSVLCPLFETGLRTHAERHGNLVAYVRRGTERWFPELA